MHAPCDHEDFIMEDDDEDFNPEDERMAQLLEEEKVRIVSFSLSCVS
jgi:hypothetical protein